MRARTAKDAVECLCRVAEEAAAAETGGEIDGDTWNWVLQVLGQVEKEVTRDADATIGDVVDGRVSIEFPADQLQAVLSAVRAGKRNCEGRARNTKSEATAATVKVQGLALERLAIVLGGLAERG